MVTDHSYFKSQSYSRIRRQCQQSKTLFIDQEFPASLQSLQKNTNSKSSLANVEWKRPWELCSNPRLVSNSKLGITHDVIQGQLGNCWFVVGMSVLATVKNQWKQLLPDYEKQEQWNQEQGYCGLFLFRFYDFDKKIDVVIDDRLPTINGQLIYSKSRNNKEFFAPLLEKAYAKLSGCYENLEGGNLQEALIDFTGGICETLSIDPICSWDELKRKDLFSVISKAFDRGSWLTCAINVTNMHEVEQRLSCGLIKGHAYAITAIRNFKIKENPSLLARLIHIGGRTKEILQMIRLRNPWGEKEWNGPWSDNSAEWKKLTEKDRANLGLTFEEDGEFWMEFVDFCRYFNEIVQCCIMNTKTRSSFLGRSQRRWYEGRVIGKWSRPDRCGGCLNYRQTFLQNPQYIFQIQATNTTEERELLINLEQRSRRSIGQQVSNLYIGFIIMKCESNRQYRLHQLYPVLLHSSFINCRNVFARTKLTYGKYIIIPSTFDPDCIGDFQLRLYTEEINLLSPLELEYPTPHPLYSCFPCLIRGPVRYVVHLNVESADLIYSAKKPLVIHTYKPYIEVQFQNNRQQISP
ncbi:unnamed protein product, partial [Didymodactylos carnosus]